LDDAPATGRTAGVCRCEPNPSGMSAVRHWSRRLSVWLAGWVLVGGVYLLLIDTTDLPELLVGAGITLLAATAFGLAREQYLAAETVRLAWLARVYRPLAQTPTDIVTVVWTALEQLRHPRDIRGVFRAVPFVCGDDAPREIGRRALAESLGSFAPNTIIIGVDPERELLLGHQLHRRGGREAIDILGLGNERGQV
jgi:hypothetical protein